MRSLGLLLVLSFVSLGCRSVETQRSEALDLRAPQRLVVLPFEDTAEGDQGLAIPLGALMDVVPLLSDDDQAKGRAREIMRAKVLANLHWTSLELALPPVVDPVLETLRRPPGALGEVQRAAYARDVRRALGVDLVLFGRITEWDRHYVVVASWVAITVELELRDGRSGRVLFRSELSDVETAGLHKGMIATEPAEILVVGIGETLRGLRNTLFASLSNELSRVAIQELMEAGESRPVTISHLAASRWGPELRVVAIGTPGARALLRLPGAAPFLMSETAPGVFQARLLDLPDKPGPGDPVRVELANRTQRVSAQAVVASARSALSPP